MVGTLAYLADNNTLTEMFEAGLEKKSCPNGGQDRFVHRTRVNKGILPMLASAELQIQGFEGNCKFYHAQALGLTSQSPLYWPSRLVLMIGYCSIHSWGEQATPNPPSVEMCMDVVLSIGVYLCDSVNKNNFSNVVIARWALFQLQLFVKIVEHDLPASLSEVIVLKFRQHFRLRNLRDWPKCKERFPKYSPVARTDPVEKLLQEHDHPPFRKDFVLMNFYSADRELFNRLQGHDEALKTYRNRVQEFESKKLSRAREKDARQYHGEKEFEARVPQLTYPSAKIPQGKAECGTKAYKKADKTDSSNMNPPEGNKGAHHDTRKIDALLKAAVQLQFEQQLPGLEHPVNIMVKPYSEVAERVVEKILKKGLVPQTIAQQDGHDLTFCLAFGKSLRYQIPRHLRAG